jgi:hypothetical protein
MHSAPARCAHPVFTARSGLPPAAPHPKLAELQLLQPGRQADTRHLCNSTSCTRCVLAELQQPCHTTQPLQPLLASQRLQRKSTQPCSSGCENAHAARQVARQAMTATQARQMNTHTHKHTSKPRTHSLTYTRPQHIRGRPGVITHATRRPRCSCSGGCSVAGP